MQIILQILQPLAEPTTAQIRLYLRLFRPPQPLRDPAPPPSSVTQPTAAPPPTSVPPASAHLTSLFFVVGILVICIYFDFGFGFGLYFVIIALYLGFFFFFCFVAWWSLLVRRCLHRRCGFGRSMASVGLVGYAHLEKVRGDRELGLQIIFVFSMGINVILYV